jgi:hypothetical protein
MCPISVFRAARNWKWREQASIYTLHVSSTLWSVSEQVKHRRSLQQLLLNVREAKLALHSFLVKVPVYWLGANA